MNTQLLPHLWAGYLLMKHLHLDRGVTKHSASADHHPLQVFFPKFVASSPIINKSQYWPCTAPKHVTTAGNEMA